MRRLLLLMSLFGLKVKQLNSARRQIRRNGDEGGGGEAGGGWGDTTLWQGLATSGYADNKNTSLIYRPTTVG